MCLAPSFPPDVILFPQISFLGALWVTCCLSLVPPPLPLQGCTSFFPLSHTTCRYSVAYVAEGDPGLRVLVGLKPDPSQELPQGRGTAFTDSELSEVLLAMGQGIKKKGMSA